MKPNLKELNLEKLKKIAAKTPRIRVKLTRKHWIFIGCAVVVLVVLLVVLLRPRPQAAALPSNRCRSKMSASMASTWAVSGPSNSSRSGPASKVIWRRCSLPREPISRRARRFSSSTRRSIAPVRTRPRRS